MNVIVFVHVILFCDLVVVFIYEFKRECSVIQLLR